MWFILPIESTSKGILQAANDTTLTAITYYVPERLAMSTTLKNKQTELQCQWQPLNLTNLTNSVSHPNLMADTAFSMYYYLTMFQIRKLFQNIWITLECWDICKRQSTWRVDFQCLRNLTEPLSLASLAKADAPFHPAPQSYIVALYILIYKESLIFKI